MERTTFIFLVLAFIMVKSGLAQDMIVKTTGDTINCKITRIDSSHIFYNSRLFGKMVNTYLPKDSIIDYRHDYFGKEKSPHWFNIGMGMGLAKSRYSHRNIRPSAVIGYSVQSGRSLISIRYLLSLEYFDLLGGLRKEESFWDFGALYGRLIKGSEGFVSLSGGIGIISGVYPGFIKTHIGFPIEGQLFWTPTSHFGVGINGFANVNTKKSFGGVLFCLQFRRLR